VVRLVTAGAVVAAAALGLATGWRSPGWWVPPVVALLTVPAELARTDVVLGRRQWRLALPDLLVGAVLLVAPGAWSAAAVAAGTAVALLAGHLPRLNVVFAAARIAAATGAGAAALLGATAALGRPAGLVAGLLGYVACGQLLSGLAVAATAHRSPWRLLRFGAGPAAAQAAGNTALGMLAGLLALRAPLGLLGLLVAAGLVVVLRLQGRRHAAEVGLYVELVRAQEQVSGRSVDASAQVVLTAAARLLGGADVELLLRHPGGPVRYAGDEYGVRDRAPVGGDAFDVPWVLRALGRRRVHTGVEQSRPYVAAAIGGGTPWAVLVARRPAGASGFGRRDRLRVSVLVEQAATWLAVSELTGWDAPYEAEPPAGVDARSLPALRTVREATHRLARLAQRLDSPDPVADLVAELHAAERAVAAFLGALATGPDQPVPADETVPGPPDRRTEWTTTGRPAAFTPHGVNSRGLNSRGLDAGQLGDGQLWSARLGSPRR